MKKGLSIGAAILIAATASAFAAATGQEIRAALSDNTVQGNMDATGPYAEFYQADGTIKGRDYIGAWSVEGNAMCFVYQDTPKECWNVEVHGDQVHWVKDGKSLGTGTIQHGNPNAFGPNP